MYCDYFIQWLWLFSSLLSRRVGNPERSQWFCSKSWWPCYLHKFIGANTTSIFWIYSLTVVFDLNADQLTWLILSAFPIFAIGLAEDLGYDMSPKARLLASAVSSLIAVMLFKVWLSKLGIPILDILLMFSPFAIFFTMFATVGVVNAFNLIDGINGLSSYVSISIAISRSIVAFHVGNLQFTIFLALLSAAILGFMTLNFPFGKIFLVTVAPTP